MLRRSWKSWASNSSWACWPLDQARGLGVVERAGAGIRLSAQDCRRDFAGKPREVRRGAVHGQAGNRVKAALVPREHGWGSPGSVLSTPRNTQGV